MVKKFDKNDKLLTEQFENIAYIEESGLSEAELQNQAEMIYKENYSNQILKARVFELILKKSRIAVDKHDIFQDKLFGGNILKEQTYKLLDEAKEKYLPEETKDINLFYNCGAGWADADFGHTSPNTKLLIEVGFPGLLDRINMYASR